MMHVLVIEPDIQMAKTMQAFLKEKYTVTVVSDGQTAVQCLDELKVDVVILEPALPAHNGVEFLYELRSYTDLQSVPAIVYAAHPPAQLNALPFKEQLGIAAVLTKTQHSLRQLASVINDTQVVRT